MANLGDIGRWIADNESLLSGLVALVVLLGLVLSPIGKGIRRLYARRAQARSLTPSSKSDALAHTAATDEPLLAVLAFDNLSNDPEMQFFSDGVSEEIIQRLSRGARRISRKPGAGSHTCDPSCAFISPLPIVPRALLEWKKKRPARRRSIPTILMPLRGNSSSSRHSDDSWRATKS